ncbi:flagellar biosynthesis protein FlhF [Campylobacter mucosalis]|uniref:flagellar biosynthesis protein FlhF n=1 Tax=Campylobacter mucosalis TaxID=202 RepID=UPI0004D809CB|nr:flagellar biosynthesis protein FlhF [Campylobacter mucosalis]KEA46082.1 flagellar biosynthesis regulator FlhF [Campylobacter mucosalis]QKF63493.1 polar flagellar biogenesis protein FlhF [Campylobacter mucosalis]
MATKFYTFTGESAIEALKKAREQCGEDAIHVTTKQIQAKSINKKPIFEILVSVEEPDEPKSSINPKVKEYETYAPPKQKKFSVTEAPVKAPTPSEDVMLNISKAAREISEITNTAIPESSKISPSELGVNKKIDDVAKQVNALNDKVSLIADMFWDERSSSRNHLPIPPEFASIYKAASDSGMKDEHLEAIMQTTMQNMPPAMKANPVAVKRYFYSLLRNMLPCRKEQGSKKQRIMMLVGPTGVGKTTTLAKLAARFAYGKERRYKVGIITLDTYRIGAVEQLFQYAKMMKLPILDVIEVDDFKNAIKTLNYCDVILVDTTGNSQYDKEKLDKLDNFLRHSDADIDVNLVLSAGSKVEDLLEIYNGFSFLDIDTLIITKFDETRIFGNVFSLIYETNTPVSYFCVGQEVPDDLLEAKSEFLVSCVLEGYEKGKR